jgi:hypothetical protein
MKTKYLTFAFIALVLMFIGLSIGIVVGMKRGIPFVTQKEQWTIGIYRGSSPFSFDSPLNRLNPVLKAEHVTDVPASFVADPFLVKEDDTWYLFFEVYNISTQQGDLAVATSTNTWFWKYQKVILDEPFHLSYPYVFKWENDYYMIPESYEANAVRLYRAEQYPTDWSFVTELVSGRELVDNSIIYHEGRWYLFSCSTSIDTLHLFYAENLTGPWKEHPASPVVIGDNSNARPSGRVFVLGDRLYRYAMDIEPPVGLFEVKAFEITRLTPTDFSEVLVREEPIIKASGSGWNAKGMHQLDPVIIKEGSWIASVDGYGTYPIFGINY